MPLLISDTTWNGQLCQDDEIELGPTYAGTYQYLTYTTKRIGPKLCNGLYRVYVKKWEVEKRLCQQLEKQSAAS